MASRSAAQLHTPDEAAEILRCSPDHVYRLITDGVLSAVDIARGNSRQPKTRIREDELLAYVNGHTTNAKRLTAAS